MELPVVGKVKNPFPWILGTAIGGTLLVGVIATVATINAVQSRGDVEELTIPAKEEALLSRIRASGTIVPLKSVNISPKNSGRLQKLLVDRGVSVKAGQPLAAMEKCSIAQLLNPCWSLNKNDLATLFSRQRLINNSFPD